MTRKQAKRIIGTLYTTVKYSDMLVTIYRLPTMHESMHLCYKLLKRGVRL